MSARLGVPVTPADSPEALVRAAQVVVTTTPSTRPLIRADWLHPGLHITAMGTDLPGKQELDAQILRRADLVVCDTIQQCLIGGELQHMAQPAFSATCSNWAPSPPAPVRRHAQTMRSACAT